MSPLISVSTPVEDAGKVSQSSDTITVILYLTPLRFSLYPSIKNICTLKFAKLKPKSRK